MNVTAGSPARDPVQEASNGVLTPARSPLAHLLHALNQPLTGLQCSLELALAGPRTSEQYIRTLRDGLQLTERMRALVEAIREVSDLEQQGAETCETVALDGVLRETVDDLRPVAEEREIGMALQSEVPLPVWAGRQTLTSVVFRFLESALSLAASGSTFRMNTGAEKDTVWIAARWHESAGAPEHSPFSRPELGLLIARAGWKRLGAEWRSETNSTTQQVTVRLPRTAERPQS